MALTHFPGEEAERYSKFFTLDLRTFFNPFNLPTMEGVLQKLRIFAPDDEGITVIPLRGKGNGVYEIYFTEDVPVTSTCGLPFDVEVMSKNTDGTELWGTEEALVPLVPPPERPVGAPPAFGSIYRPGGGADRGGGSRQGRREGTLITMLRCTTGPLSTIKNEIFDTAIQAYGAICKPTVYQRHRGTDFFNGNRFCVLEPSTKIPDVLKLEDPESGRTFSISLRYKGKEWYCDRCHAKHTGPCADKQAFYAQKDARKEVQITTTLLSDSTLRRATEVGLQADVICMPGGCLGEVANVIRAAPAIHKQEDLVVVAGTNDVMADTTHKEFLFNVDKSCAKLLQLSTQVTPKVVVVPPNLDEEDITPVQGLRQKYLRLKLLQNAGDTLGVYTVPRVDMEDPLHPSKEGTNDWLVHLQTYYFSDKPLIMNENYITGDRIYLENKPVYIYGCTTCNQVRDVSDGYCNACREDLTNYVPDGADLATTPNSFPLLIAGGDMLADVFRTHTERAVAIKTGALVSQDGVDTININALTPQLGEMLEEMDVVDGASDAQDSAAAGNITDDAMEDQAKREGESVDGPPDGKRLCSNKASLSTTSTSSNDSYSSVSTTTASNGGL